MMQEIKTQDETFPMMIFHHWIMKAMYLVKKVIMVSRLFPNIN